MARLQGGVRPRYPRLMSPAARRPTSADVAARAGVSRATVSMVLNNRTQGTVAEATRERVLAAAQELGYARSAIAVSLREQRTRTLGLITDEIATSPWAGRMVRAAFQEAAEHGYMAITVDLSLRGSSLEGALRTLAERQVDGLLYAAMGRSVLSLPATLPRQPLVLINALEEPSSAPGGRGLPSFIPDDRGGARRAAQRLVDVGHSDIVMLSGDDAQPATLERERGFRDVIEHAGLPVRMIRAGWQMSDGHREARRLLSGGAGTPPTALFCIRDRVAAGALFAAAELGLSVPGELSLVGFDDEDFFAEQLTPPLTTIALPHEEMGVRGVRALLELIEGEARVSQAGAPERAVVVGCPLVERGTVGAGPGRDAAITGD